MVFSWNKISFTDMSQNTVGDNIHTCQVRCCNDYIAFFWQARNVAIFKTFKLTKKTKARCTTQLCNGRAKWEMEANNALSFADVGCCSGTRNFWRRWLGWRLTRKCSAIGRHSLEWDQKMLRICGDFNNWCLIESESARSLSAKKVKPDDSFRTANGRTKRRARRSCPWQASHGFERLFSVWYSHVLDTSIGHYWPILVQFPILVIIDQYWPILIFW